MTAAQIAGFSYVLVLLSNLIDLSASLHGWQGFGWTEAVMAVVALISSVLLGQSAWRWLGLPRLTLRGVSACLLGLVLAYGAAKVLGQVVTLHSSTAEFRGDGGGLPVALLVVAGFVPLLEEWLFRGVLLECLLALFPVHAAVVVCALLFAILHLSPQTVVHHGLLGYVCGRARIGSGSLWAAVACHALYNAAVVLAGW